MTPEKILMKRQIQVWLIKFTTLNSRFTFHIGITLKTVQADLAKEELENAQQTNTLHIMLPNRFLSAGLEIEEQQ
jgi:hypothetical protein